MLFFPDEADYPRQAIHEALRQNLPYSVHGYSSNFEPNYDEGDRGTLLRKTREQGPVNHLVEMFEIRDYFQHYLGSTFMRNLTPSTG